MLTARHARAAVDGGAQFLVTPGIGADAAEAVRIAHVASASWDVITDQAAAFCATLH